MMIRTRNVKWLKEYLRNSLSLRNVVLLTILCSFNLLIIRRFVTDGFGTKDLDKDKNFILKGRSVDVRTKSLADFFYRDIKKSVAKTCRKYFGYEPLQKINQNMTRWTSDLWYNFEDKLLWCEIEKVASTTWTARMMALKGFNDYDDFQLQLDLKGVKPTERRSYMRKNFFRLPHEMTPKQANQDLLTFAMVRHPFERLISAYTQKLTRKDWAEQPSDYQLKWMRNEILTRFRKLPNADLTYDNPTPLEFVRYLLAEVERVGEWQLDAHFRPVWTHCPFCTLQFDIISKVESFDTDTEILKRITKLTGKMTVKDQKEKRRNARPWNTLYYPQTFFKNIPPPLIEKLYSIYKIDFEMFGYNEPGTLEYFKGLSVEK